ncbi:MAG: YcxB family protein [candidate division Zixibacteria bacterium]|nr:YcxB family protein [candidate division Zixibacteria bacterium]
MSARKDIETNPNYNKDSENNYSLSWTNHPATQSKKRTTIVVLFLVVVFAGVYYTTNSVILTGVAVLIMFGSLTSFFLPTKFGFNDDGIYIKTLSGRREFKWSKYRNFYPDKNGVFLSPFVRPTRLENFRGVYIRFTNNREEVLEFVKKKLNLPVKENSDGSDDVVS